ncbi:NAD kinase [Serinibacter salmoneus]|uniref:NAD kinase n=1 Tax=Serinibacter salmoneus TaxID=556530 RepID=A0A2A9D0T0_9MICO|nr:NAD kinase [Serinibacter salmoneus]PFG19449.1 NAD+ kinase [Serinibacter salmoneus]
MNRCVLVVSHTHERALRARAQVNHLLAARGFRTVSESDLPHTSDGAAALPPGVELVIVLGGDGTILRAAETVRGTDVPIIGINLGHIGFLAELDDTDLEQVVEQIAARDYTVERRMTVDVEVVGPDGATRTAWAVNEAAIEKAARERMIEMTVGVDGRALESFGADGVVLATPTGSTAYAFSAGGPVVWPDVEAMLLVPLSAHALFARPLVVGPDSVLEVELLARNGTAAVMWCDGRRSLDLAPGSRVTVRRGSHAVPIARLRPGPFSSRLVAKFDLPVHGWRGGRER